MVLPSFQTVRVPKRIVFYGQDLFGTWDRYVSHAIVWLMGHYNVSILPGETSQPELLWQMARLEVPFPHARLAVPDPKGEDLLEQMKYLVRCSGIEHPADMLLVSFDLQVTEEAALQGMESIHVDNPDQLGILCFSLQANRAIMKGSSYHAGGTNTTPHRAERQLAAADYASKAVGVVG